MSMFNNEKPNREFQAGLKTDERRRSRQDERLMLRRKDRENRLQRKRQTLSNRNRQWEQSNIDGQSQSQFTNNSVQKQQEIYKRNEMLSQLPQYVQGCFQDHPAAQFECCMRIRKLLSIERNPPIKEVIDTGVVPRLVQFLRCTQYDRLQFEAAWALTNIASGTAEHTSKVIRHGAVPIFIELLQSKSCEVVEQAIWALGNIAGDSPECRNLVLSEGALTGLMPLCKPSCLNQMQQLTLQRNVTWTLSNFCRGKPSPKWEYAKMALQALSIMLMSDDDEILQDACWAFSYLSDMDDSSTTNSVVGLIVNCGALNKLINLLDHESAHVRHPALRTIGNIVTGCDGQTQSVINLGVLKKLAHLMETDKTAIKREACWTISNITAGLRDQIESVIAANLFPSLINLLANDKYEVAKEALWAISNATSGGSDHQIKFLVNQGVIAPLCKFFKKRQSKKILMVALEGIENILTVGRRDAMNNNGGGDGGGLNNKFSRYVEECGGVQALEEIIADDKIPDEIYEKSASIIKEYFGGEEVKLNSNNNGQQQQQTNSNNNNQQQQQTNWNNTQQFSFGNNQNQQNNQQNNGFYNF